MCTLRDTIKDIFNDNPVCVSYSKIIKAYEKIKKYANPSVDVIKKHNEYVRSKK